MAHRISSGENKKQDMTKLRRRQQYAKHLPILSWLFCRSVRKTAGQTLGGTTFNDNLAATAAYRTASAQSNYPRQNGQPRTTRLVRLFCATAEAAFVVNAIIVIRDFFRPLSWPCENRFRMGADIHNVSVVLSVLLSVIVGECQH